MMMTTQAATILNPLSKAYFGIDYSMSSPAIAVYVGEPRDFNWTKVRFCYHTKDPKFNRRWMHSGRAWCEGVAAGKDFLNNEERFDHLAKWTMSYILYPHHEIPRMIAMEDYAMGARGRVFEIAENTGALKQKLRASKFDFKLYPPTVVKKFAFGKGNAKKEQMYEAWMKETDFDIWKEMTPGRGKISSPVTDIVDAYFILKKLVEEDNGH